MKYVEADKLEALAEKWEKENGPWDSRASELHALLEQAVEVPGAEIAEANAVEQCAIEAGELSPEGVSSHTMLGDMWAERVSRLRALAASRTARDKQAVEVPGAEVVSALQLIHDKEIEGYVSYCGMPWRKIVDTALAASRTARQAESDGGEPRLENWNPAR